jgi:heme/copper-type cytochrome/quinol oxidase subunit 2
LHFLLKIDTVKENAAKDEIGMLVIQTVLFAFIVAMLLISVYFSFRYRREKDMKKRGLFAARMNICMGIMLVAISVTQLFFFTDSTVRRIFGTVCLLLGLFNLFAGIRNHGVYQRMDRQG